MNKYVSNKYRLGDGKYSGDAPSIGLFSSANVGKTAHYAMIVGTAKSDSWWIFKNYYYVISHWYDTHEKDGNGNIKEEYDTKNSYYIVGQGYKISEYQMYRKNDKKWYQAWKPDWVVLKK